MSSPSDSKHITTPINTKPNPISVELPNNLTHDDLAQVNLVRLRLSTALSSSPSSKDAIKLEIRFNDNQHRSGLEIDSAVLTNANDFQMLIEQISNAYKSFVPTSRLKSITISIRDIPTGGQKDRRQSSHVEDERYLLRLATPLWSLEDVILPEQTRRDILRALTRAAHLNAIYYKWHMIEVDPFPKCAINLFGPPGTGKTMAAHGIAHSLGRSMLSISPAEIESRYVGEAAKNVLRVFNLSQSTNSVIFFDEADSLLGKRVHGITQGAEQAINSLRSQLLLALDSFSGLVVFASNLPANYDSAFLSRMAHVQFYLPDKSCRNGIWTRCLRKELPLAPDVDPEALASIFEGISGREIKDSVLDAVSDLIIERKELLRQDDLVRAAQNLISRRRNLQDPT